MLERELKRLESQKACLLDQSAAYRDDFQVQIGPVRDLSHRIDFGIALGRQGLALLVAFAPVLSELLQRRRGLLKIATTIVSNWRLARGAWNGIQALRERSVSDSTGDPRP